MGKSSLLRAGVSARLRQLAARSVAERGSARYVPVVFSAWRGDPKADADRRARGRRAAAAARRRASSRSGATRSKHAIEDVVGGGRRDPARHPRPVRGALPVRGRRRRFDDELAHCINRRDLRANFLISVREDAYSLIGSRFKARIPNVYGNYLHLDFLDERAARDAIARARRRVQRGASPTDAPRFEVEPALVDAVLEQVRRGRVTHRRRRRRRMSAAAGPRPRGDGLPAARHEAPVGRGDRPPARSGCGWRRCDGWAARTRSSTATSTTSWPSCPRTSATPPRRRSASS